MGKEIRVPWNYVIKLSFCCFLFQLVFKDNKFFLNCSWEKVVSFFLKIKSHDVLSNFLNFPHKNISLENWKYFLVGHGFLILLEKMLDTSEKIKFKFPWKFIKNKMLEGINFPKLKKTFLNIAWNTSKSLNWFSKTTSKKGFSFKLVKYKLFKFHFPLSTWLSFVKRFFWLFSSIKRKRSEIVLLLVRAWEIWGNFSLNSSWIFNDAVSVLVILYFPRSLIYYSFISAIYTHCRAECSL